MSLGILLVDFIDYAGGDEEEGIPPTEVMCWDAKVVKGQAFNDGIQVDSWMTDNFQEIRDLALANHLEIRMTPKAVRAHTKLKE